MANTPTPPAFTITGQRPDFGPLGNGQYGTGMHVDFRTSSGDFGSVFVPEAEYQADKVRARVAGLVAEMEAVRTGSA